MKVQIMLPKFNARVAPLIDLDAVHEVHLLDGNKDAQKIIYLEYEDNGQCKSLLITGASGCEVESMYLILLDVFYEYEINDFNISEANEEIKEASGVFTTLRYMS